MNNKNFDFIFIILFIISSIVSITVIVLLGWLIWEAIGYLSRH